MSTDIEFWSNFLNERAVELGLEQTIRAVQPSEGAVGVVTWVYEKPDGDLVDLGWNIEEAEAGLRRLAGA